MSATRLRTHPPPLLCFTSWQLSVRASIVDSNMGYGLFDCLVRVELCLFVRIRQVNYVFRSLFTIPLIVWIACPLRGRKREDLCNRCCICGCVRCYCSVCSELSDCHLKSRSSRVRNNLRYGNQSFGVCVFAHFRCVTPFPSMFASRWEILEPNVRQVLRGDKGRGRMMNSEASDV